MRSRLVAVVPFSLSLVLSACGDPCDGDEALLGDLVVQSAADLDVLRGKRCVTGRLTIGIPNDEVGSNPPPPGNHDITSLEALDSLEIVEDSLHIIGTCALRDLSGLENLVYVGRELRLVGRNTVFARGTLFIHFNGALESVTEMSSLEHVGADFRVEGNPRLPEANVRELREGMKVHGTSGTTIESNGDGGASPLCR